MPPRLFCAGVQRTNWTPTEEEKWDLLRLANTKGKLMKALGVITRAPKMLEYLAAALAVDAHQLTANDAVKALVPAGFRAPRVDHVFKWIERLKKLETLLQAEESGRREQLINRAEDDVCWESETGLSPLPERRSHGPAPGGSRQRSQEGNAAAQDAAQGKEPRRSARVAAKPLEHRGAGQEAAGATGGIADTSHPAPLPS